MPSPGVNRPSSSERSRQLGERGMRVRGGLWRVAAGTRRRRPRPTGRMKSAAGSRGPAAACSRISAGRIGRRLGPPLRSTSAPSRG